MNKYIIYIFIGITVLGGFYLQHYLSLSDSGEPANAVLLASAKHNRIDNSFETLLIYPKKNPVFKFTLISHTGAPFTDDDFKGYWNLIFSGYTNCPDICLPTLTQMTHLYKMMDQQTRSKYQIIFLSVDPKRDTPEHLKLYLDFFHQDFIGITGEESQLDGLVRSLGGIISFNEAQGEFYTVNHSGRIFIVGPNAERYGILKSDSLKSKDKNQLVKDLAKLSQQ